MRNVKEPVGRTRRACWVGAAAVLILIASARVGTAGVVKPFPPGFLWGVAISGFQSDMGMGAPNDQNSDWWAWVRDPQNVGGGVVSGDLPEDGPGFYLNFEKDARRVRGRLKNNAFRMGVEWSRLFPTSTAAVDISGGITPQVLADLDALANQVEVTRYRRVFEALRARGLEPMVTINHFSLPLWVHEPIAIRDAFVPVNPLVGTVPPGLTASGWLDAGIVDEFAKLAAYVGFKFGDLVDLWCTINEPVVVTVSGFINFPGIGGNFPPGVFNFSAVPVVIGNLVTAHARAYDAVHATDTTDADGDGTVALAGIVKNMVAFHPDDPQSPLDMTGADHADYLYNRAFLTAITSGDFDANLDGDTDDMGEQRPDLAGRGDFLGINYYLRAYATGLASPLTPLVPIFDFVPTISYQSPENPGGAPCPTECTDFGWEIYPDGLGEVLAYAGSFGLPIYITENGLADADDDQRAQFIFDHLAELQDVSDGGAADVRGYFHWSLTDNFEWSSGWATRFGLFSHDEVTGKQRRRRSAGVYRGIARRNGLTGSMINKYGP